MMMLKTIPIYLGLAGLILESFVGLVVLHGVAETQLAASEITTPTPSIVAMPTTGRLLFYIPAVDVLGCENINELSNTDTTIDGTTDHPMDALDLSTEDGALHTPITPAFDFPARLNDDEVEEAAPAARVYMMDPPDQIPRVRQLLPLNDGFVVLRLPSDPLLVWEVDAVVLLETFLRDHAASVPVASDYDYKTVQQQPMRQVLPMTPKGRVVFRTPTDPWTTWSVDAPAFLKFLCLSESAFGLSYDRYYEGANPDEDSQSESATAVHDEDAAADSNTQEPTAQADETCGDDDDHSGNANESTRLEILRIAILRIAVICLHLLLLCFGNWKPDLTEKKEPAPQPALQPREFEFQAFWEPVPIRTVEHQRGAKIYGQSAIPPGGFSEYLKNRIQKQKRRSQGPFR